MNKVFEEFKKLPLIVQIAIIALVIFLAWKAYVYATAYTQETKRRAEDKAEIDVLVDSGVKPSYNKDKYIEWADDLEEAMTGAGTTIATVYDVFENLQNDADFILLEKAFGLRLSASTDWWLGGWGISPSDLSDWIKGDLSITEIKQLNDQLERQGITKKF